MKITVSTQKRLSLWITVLLLQLINHRTTAQSAILANRFRHPSLTYFKILNGVEAQLGQFPFQLSLRYQGEHRCGAVIIDQFHALTAAHCFQKGENPSDYDIVAGKIFLTHTNKNQQILTVSAFTVHPFYSAETKANDIAFVWATGGVLTFNSFVNKVAMPGPLLPDLTGYTATAIGWGTKEYAGQISEILQYVQLPIVANNECEKAYSTLGDEIRDSMVCAGGLADRKDTCGGDSGGPLVVELAPGDYMLVGLTSFGYFCGSSGFPGVYTRVSSFTEWIGQMMDQSLPPAPTSRPPPPPTPISRPPPPPTPTNRPPPPTPTNRPPPPTPTNRPPPPTPTNRPSPPTSTNRPPPPTSTNRPPPLQTAAVLPPPPPPAVIAMATPSNNFLDLATSLHNGYRGRHGVSPLTLDFELSREAQDYADQSVGSPYVLQAKQGIPYGQNVFQNEGRTIDPNTAVQRAIDTWYEGIASYNWAFPSASTASAYLFTQIVWRSSWRLGVGVGMAGTRTVVIAFYSPPGNVVGDQNYRANVFPARY